MFRLVIKGDLTMRDPYRKKQRDLCRIARSAQNPCIYDLFDAYNPEYKDYDRSYFSEDWRIYWNAQREWVSRFTGGVSSGGVPASFRRDRNRELRTRQKAALNRAFREDDWDDFSLPRGRRDIGWDYW